MEENILEKHKLKLIYICLNYWIFRLENVIERSCINRIEKGNEEGVLDSPTPPPLAH